MLMVRDQIPDCDFTEFRRMILGRLAKMANELDHRVVRDWHAICVFYTQTWKGMGPMANVSETESNALWRHMRRQLKFPPFLTLYAGTLGILAWNSFVGGSAEPTLQLVRATVPLWAGFTVCFFIVSRQSRVVLSTVGCIGLLFSVIALALTVTELSGR
jgi:hypothetical protein